MYQIYRNMYNAIGVKDVDAVLPPPAPMAPMDPSLEHINAMADETFSSFSWSRPQSTHHSAFKLHVN